MLFDIKHNDLFENIKEKNKTYSDYNKIMNALNFEKTVHTCLHCGNDTPLYCENCQQELISKNAELQLENEKYRKYHLRSLKRWENKFDKQEENFNELLDDYIPKQVIRDKIQELYKDKDSKYYDMFLEERDIEKTISILKELLGE